MKMDKRFIGFIIVIIIILSLFGFMLYSIIDGGFYLKARSESCNKLNMEYYTTQDSTFCMDEKGNAYYVKFDCKQISLFGYDCTPKIITVQSFLLNFIFIPLSFQQV